MREREKERKTERKREEKRKRRYYKEAPGAENVDQPVFLDAIS